MATESAAVLRFTLQRGWHICCSGAPTTMERFSAKPLALALALATLVARSSKADEDDYTPTPRTSVSEAPRSAPDPVAVPIQVETRRNWYGWQTLSTDGAAFSLLVLGGSLISNDNTDSGVVVTDSFVILSAASYALGGPIVHAAHQNWGTAAASLGLRVGLPLTGILIGSAADRCGANNDSDVCGAVGPGIGALLGIGAAIAIDATTLAYDQVSLASAATTRQPLAAISAPFVVADAHRTMLGVMGTF
jgi:hypothetical protein